MRYTEKNYSVVSKAIIEAFYRKITHTEALKRIEMEVGIEAGIYRNFDGTLKHINKILEGTYIWNFPYGWTVNMYENLTNEDKIKWLKGIENMIEHYRIKYNAPYKKHREFIALMREK